MNILHAMVIVVMTKCIVGFIDSDTAIQIHTDSAPSPSTSSEVVVNDDNVKFKQQVVDSMRAVANAI